MIRQSFGRAFGGPRTVQSLGPQAVDGQLALPVLVGVVAGREFFGVFATEFRLVGHAVDVVVECGVCVAVAGGAAVTVRMVAVMTEVGGVHCGDGVC